MYAVQNTFPSYWIEVIAAATRARSGCHHGERSSSSASVCRHDEQVIRFGMELRGTGRMTGRAIALAEGLPSLFINVGDQGNRISFEG